MTSASGETFANGDVDEGLGVREVTTTLTVDVGDKWSASGCGGSGWLVVVGL